MSPTSIDHRVRELEASHKGLPGRNALEIEDKNHITSFEHPIDAPSGFTHLRFPVISPFLTLAQTRWLRQRPQSPDPTSQSAEVLQVVKLPFGQDDTRKQIEVRRVTDERHPAYGQFGLFAARDLDPGELIIPYVGYVHSSTSSETAESELRLEHENESTPSTRVDVGHAGSTVPSLAAQSAQSTPEVAIGSWDTSSYDLNLHRDETIELAIDAALMGNEARFCNDYRNVPMDSHSLTLRANQRWSRNTKRAAKGWDTNNTTAQGTIQHHKSDEFQLAIPNAEFNDIWLEWAVDHQSCDVAPHQSGTSQGPDRRKRKKNTGMRGIAIFVLPAGKSGKRRYGIRSGQEILVSYGKGFWAHRGNKET